MEQWWLCKDEYLDAVAEALVVAHAKCWALLHYSIGIYDLPVSRAYREVIIDTTKVMRKEANYKVKSGCMEYNEMGTQYHFNSETGYLNRVTFDDKGKIDTSTPLQPYKA